MSYMGKETIYWDDGDVTTIDIEIDPDIISEIEQKAVKKYRTRLRKFIKNNKIPDKEALIQALNAV
ncbi:hypothetical protein AAEX28_13345 [Lentisphaerota bacterium WC36G]|nr:hypothetical protein LJT99_00110 [Lentisphaerae bacterium WC36]